MPQTGALTNYANPTIFALIYININLAQNGAPKNFTEFELVCRGVFKKITFFNSLAKNSPQDCFLNARLRVPFGAT